MYQATGDFMCLSAGISMLLVFMDSVVQFKDYDHTLAMAMMLSIHCFSADESDYKPLYTITKFD